MQLFVRLVETFGPFLIPATLFAVGVGAYALLWLVTGREDPWAAENGSGGGPDDDTR